jgi:hypothetical protein
VTNIRLRVIETPFIADRTLIYRIGDYAFDADPGPPDSALSLGLNSLKLIVDDRDDRLVCVIGYCPHPGWRSVELDVPVSHPGRVIVEAKPALIPGVTVRINDADRQWPVCWDSKTGWICIGQTEASSMGRAVEFNNGMVAVLDGGDLLSLWLHPRRIP